jgi:hypothetical protein
MDDEREIVLTPEQWTAARMFVALLGVEAREGGGEDFDFEMIGVEVLPVDNVVFALTADHEICVGDMLYASKLLLWSLICQFAEHEGIDVADAVSVLAMRLAAEEPT